MNGIDLSVASHLAVSLFLPAATRLGKLTFEHARKKDNSLITTERLEPCLNQIAARHEGAAAKHGCSLILSDW